MNININTYFHMIPLWRSPIKLPLWSYPWSCPPAAIAAIAIAAIAALAIAIAAIAKAVSAASVNNPKTTEPPSRTAGF